MSTQYSNDCCFFLVAKVDSIVKIVLCAEYNASAERRAGRQQVAPQLPSPYLQFESFAF